MKNYQISPGQIPHLVRLTADLFRNMREETKAPNMNSTFQRDEHEQMHFMAELLKDLVETTYPQNLSEHRPLSMKKSGLGEFVLDYTSFLRFKQQLKDLDKQMDSIAKMMKGYKPPKVGEF